MLAVPSAFSVKGEVFLVATDPETGDVVSERYAHNLVTNSGLRYVSNFLAGRLGTVEASSITHLAIGTGDAVLRSADIMLVSEHRRQEVDVRQLQGNSLIRLQAFFASTSASIDIEEVGAFISPNAATTDVDTGILFSRALLSFNNSGVRPADLTLEWHITLLSQ